NGGTSLVLNQVDETLEVAHWGQALPSVTDASLLATKRAIAHGDLDVNPRNLILRDVHVVQDGRANRGYVRAVLNCVDLHLNHRAQLHA
ncbi:MAG: hypothetical protein ACKN92_05440, partial [Candidatus Nanopelagicaceae bacterium]